MVRELCPQQRVSTSLSVRSVEGEEDTVQGLKTKIKELALEQKEINTNIFELEGEGLVKKTQMKALALHVEHLEEKGKKLAAANESHRVTKRQIISHQINRSRPKRTAKATIMIYGSF